MADVERLKREVSRLFAEYAKLPNKSQEIEKKAEEYLRCVFEAMDWNWLGREVTPQYKIRTGKGTKKVDYSFRKLGAARHDFYMEVKRFSNSLNDPEDARQAINYGKNSGIRWVILTNFVRWRVFNSDFFDDFGNAELFEFDLSGISANPEYLGWLLLFAKENGGGGLDEYAKKHKKWKESADIEDMLTEQLISAREELTRALRDDNERLFEETFEEDGESVSLDACVQLILNRLIFCRQLEDNGADTERRMREVFESWSDKRVQFYRDYLCKFWEKMRKVYDSTIFDNHRIDGLSIKNESFLPVFESFYRNRENGLSYRFEAISKDVLGHAYENYLSYKIKKTAKRIGLEKELYKRKRSGIFYTPEFFVDYLVRATLGEKLKNCASVQDALRIRVLDPACGSGTFLARALEEFRAWFEERMIKTGQDSAGLSDFLGLVVDNCLYGIDLDPKAIRLAKLNLFLRVADSPKKLPDPKIIQRNSLLEDHDRKFFSFERDFPLVFEHGGFDVVLGNPPWEKWKPNSQEFFEKYYEGFKSLQTQKAKKVMEEILQKRAQARKEWNDYVNEYEVYSDYFRSHYKFQSAEGEGRRVSGDLDLYKLFTEKAYTLLKEGGMCGFVVPSGIYTDLGAKGLRKMLFEKCKVASLYSFENRGHAIFPDVHASYKPILLTFEKGGKTSSFPCAFFLHTAEDLEKAVENPTVLDVEFVKRSSPTSWSVLEVKSPRDKEIIEKMLKFPPLGKEIGGVWNIEMQSGFHMTNDAHLFKKDRLGGIPLLEGKNIEQFTHQWKEAPTARYVVLEKDVLANLKEEKRYHAGYWIGFRDVASSTNYRTLLATVVPPGYVCGNTINIVRTDVRMLCFLCGVMNSFVVDYFIRQKVSAHVNQFNFLEIPIPRLSSGKEFEAIAKKTAQLTATTDEFEELKKEIGIREGIKDENDRMLARAQIDAEVAKLYGIGKEDLAYILEKFPNVDPKQKELVLNAYYSVAEKSCNTYCKPEGAGRY